ncbi:MAG TPA: hypothetical protein VFC07_12215, partial [Verrucomicrobiae bacterium]|nr:hypothetical protein [Verrucomicrobiae bacterium]
MKLKLALVYLSLLVLSFAVTAVIWSLVAPERYYHCWDFAPVVTFIPPFVHLESPLNQQEFDHYILPEQTVYSIWFAFIVAATLLPAVPVLVLGRLWRFYERHELFTNEAEPV